VFHAGSAVYLAGFCVLMFALIAAHGLQARQAGRFGTVGVSVAIVGTMLLAGDLWFGPSPCRGSRTGRNRR
jgi:hypothetical protein